MGDIIYPRWTILAEIDRLRTMRDDEIIYNVQERARNYVDSELGILNRKYKLINRHDRTWLEEGMVIIMN